MPALTEGSGHLFSWVPMSGKGMMESSMTRMVP